MLHFLDIDILEWIQFIFYFCRSYLPSLRFVSTLNGCNTWTFRVWRRIRLYKHLKLGIQKVRGSFIFTTWLGAVMAPHSSTLAWKIPWTEEPGRLQPMGSLRVGHDWATSLLLFTFMHWRRKWQPTPVFLPGESQPGGLLSMGLHRVGHDWSDLAVAVAAAISKQIFIYVMCVC